jgi:hypothetical protein
MLIGLVAVVAAQFVGLRRRLNRVLLSPLTLVAAGFAGMGLVGGRVYEAVQYAPFGGSIRIVLDDDQTQLTICLFLVATAALLAGGGAVLLLAPRPAEKLTVRWRITVPPNVRLPALAVATLPMAAVWIAVGPTSLMWRDRYIEAHVVNSPLLSLAVPLSMASSLMLGSLLVSRSAPIVALASLVAVGYEVTYFAVGSRVLALVPVLMVVGVSLGRERPNRWGVVSGAAVSVVLLPIPLYLRAQSAHGFWPYFEAMQVFDLQAVGVDSMLRNVFISFGLVGATAFTVGSMPWEVFAISVNPLPGSMIGWYDIAGSERLNLYTPYAALGEVGNRGTLTVVSFYSVVGVVLGVLELRVRAHLRAGHVLAALIPVALSALFILSSYQYNLRTSCRVLLYAVLVEVLVASAASVLRRRSPTRSGPDRGVDDTRRIRSSFSLGLEPEYEDLACRHRGG